MRTVRLVVAYDGTGFHGWQTQPEMRTVQRSIEEVLADVLNEPDVRLHGAGRTDSGVHARGQVASFVTEAALPARAFAPLLNRRLPGDVRVREAADAPSGFHARHSARARRYAYRLLEREDVLIERFAWACRRRFDAERLDRATRCLEGEADFSAFQSTGSSPANPRCRVHRARWSRQRGGARLDIVADHFLYHMVRNIVGTALAAAASPDPAAAMREVLVSGSRARGGVTVPAHGLCLERVYYDEQAAR